MNSKAIVDFMSDLHVVLLPIYPKYCDNRNLLQFENFLEFARDHDIFPQSCSKASLSRIFYSLARLRESLNPTISEAQIKRDLSELDISVMSPSGLERINSPNRA